jgi:hypothetical protein
VAEGRRRALGSDETVRTKLGHGCALERAQRAMKEYERPDSVPTAAGPRDLIGINVLKELSHFRQATVEGEDHGVKGSW